MAKPLQVEAREGAPTLQTISREGDPRSAVSLAVHARTSREALGLLGLVRARLTQRPPSFVTINSHGFTLTELVQDAVGATAFFRAVQAALTTPVRANDAAIANVERRFQKERSRPQSASPVDACLSRLGSDTPDWSSLGADELEGVRSSLGASHIGLAALGHPKVLQAARQAQEWGWPTGDALEPEAELATSWVVRDAPGRVLRVALQTPRIPAALGAARAFESPEHALRARLEPLSGSFRYQSAEVTLTPQSACLGVTLVQQEGAGRASPETLARIVSATQEELSLALDLTASGEDLALSILSPSNPVDAVTLAAWTATSAPLRSGEIWLGEANLPQSDGLAPADLEKALSKLSSLPRAAISVERRIERGQPESWVLLASPCGVGAEPGTEAGFRAATLEAIALEFSGKDGVALEPWYGEAGTGLMAHTARLRAESPRNHALRLTRRLAMALYGPELDGREVARARAQLIRAVGDDPARELALSVLGGEHPSLLDARGSAEALGRFSTLDAQRIRAELAAEPLRAAFLDNSEVDQSAAVREGLDSWFASTRAEPSPCSVAQVTPAKPGIWHLESVSEPLAPGRYVAIPSPGSPEAGLAIEFLLGRSGGFLERALIGAPFAANFDVAYLGGERVGGFVIRLNGEPAALDPALQQVRAVLDDLSVRGIPATEVALASAAFERGELERAENPRNRVIDSWLKRGPKSPKSALSSEKLSPHIAALRGAAHRVITLDVKP